MYGAAYDTMDTVIYDSLAAAIAGCFGGKTVMEKMTHIGGGDINRASCLQLSNGTRVFVKSNTLANRSFFEAEETGLNAIAATQTIRTPALLCRGTDEARGISFLMMELLPGTAGAPDFWETFGRNLARMHGVETGAFVRRGRFGFIEDNYIGASVQSNEERDSWIDFFRECRLLPQLEMAAGYFEAPMRRNIDRLLARLDMLLAEPEAPSLLHGDLWSGNYITGTDGQAWLIDPAVYVGHAEADLAMTELFGGFAPSFYGAYQEIRPLDEGYARRRDLYNLYHLLNHLNLFGTVYLPAVTRTMLRYL